uniref:Major facilitator superfamily (MFS) profile domain-containing protein n=1 Tax=Eptatretus burgeri TaxID=7764 RepID=A0A8C4Q119_EPTBU
MKQMAQSVYMAGVLIGAIVMGGLADIFGRRNVMLVNNLIVAVTGTCAAFSPSIDAYIVARFLLGLGIMGSYLNAYSLGLEWLDTRHRVLFATTMAYAYTTGQLVLAGLAYAVRDWRSLQLYVSAPYFLFFAFSWFHPESARWLMLQGRYKDALKWFEHVAKINSRNITNDLLSVEVLEKAMESSSAPSKKTYTAFHLLKLVELRRRTFIISLIWFATSFCYFGVAMNLQGFKVNIFLLMLIFSAVDFPATLIVLAMISLIGRRAATGTPLLLAGCTCIAVVFIPTDMEMLRTSFAVVGKGAVAGVFNTLFLVAGEIYPTVIRQVGMGTTSTMARVGGMLAPLVTISGEIYPLFPQIIYGGVSLIAGLVAFLLPEMLNKPLADTIEDLKCQKMRKSKRQANEEKAAATSLLVPKTIQESHI